MEEEIDINIARRNELLEKIFYRKDRIRTIIMKTTFQKFNLRAKLLSLKADKKERKSISNSKNRGKKRKNTSKSVPANHKQK